MKKAQMNISHYHFTLLNLKIFGEIVTTLLYMLGFLAETLPERFGSHNSRKLRLAFAKNHS